MGVQFRAPLKPFDTIVLGCSRGFRGASIGPLMHREESRTVVVFIAYVIIVIWIFTIKVMNIAMNELKENTYIIRSCFNPLLSPTQATVCVAS